MSSSTDSRARWSPPLATAVLLVVLSLLVVGQMYSALALTDQIAGDLHVAPADVTSATTAFGIAYALAFLIAGPLSDRFGPRAVILVGLLLCAVTTALVTVAPTLTVLVVLRAVQGVSAASFAPAAFSYIARHVAPERRAVVLTSVTSAMLASAIIIQIAFTRIGEVLGWRGSFLVAAAAVVAAALIARITLLAGPRMPDATLSRTLRVIPALLARGELLALYLATVGVMTAFVGLYTALALAGPAYVADPAILLTLRATALPAFVLVAAFAPLLARVAISWRIPVGMLLAAVSLVVASTADTEPLLLGVAQFVFVAAIAMTAPAIVQRVSSLVPDNAGTAVALYACAMFAGASIGPQLVRLLLPIGFTALLFVLGAVLACAAGAAVLATRLARGTTPRS